MKKKLTAVALVVCMLAIMLVGASLAYFTDEDEATNTFTVGNVSIELIEEFAADKETGKALLMPGTKEQNAVNKDVWVKNDGANAAWVRVKVYIPSQLDQLTNPDYINNHETAATFNTVHFNTKGGNDTIWNVSKANNEAKQVSLEDGDYNEYIFYYNEKLTPGAQTEQLLDQVYLDKAVDCDITEDGAYVWTKGDKVVDYALENGVNIIVKAEAIQADGFDTYEAAFAAFDAQN